MALTNKGLKEILSKAGVDAEHMEAAVTEIMSGHNTSVNALTEARDNAVNARNNALKERDDARKERDIFKADAEKLGAVQKELDTLKNGDWENKYKAILAENTARETRVKKEAAVREYLTGKNITGKSLDIAMLGCAAQIDAMELDKDGKKIKDTSALDALVNGTFALLVSHDVTEPAHNPPAASPDSKPVYTNLSEAMRAKNENPALNINYDLLLQPTQT